MSATDITSARDYVTSTYPKAAEWKFINAYTTKAISLTNRAYEEIYLTGGIDESEGFDPEKEGKRLDEWRESMLLHAPTSRLLPN